MGNGCQSMVEMQADWVAAVDHPAFAGHFPGRPIVPGVVLLDRALLLAEQIDSACRWDIVQAKFLWPVGPGATVRFALAQSRAELWLLEIRCGAQLVASGVLRQERWS